MQQVVRAKCSQQHALGIMSIASGGLVKIQAVIWEAGDKDAQSSMSEMEMLRLGVGAGM